MNTIADGPGRRPAVHGGTESIGAQVRAIDIALASDRASAAVPVVLAERVGKQLVIRHCPHCGQRHYHGAHGCSDPSCGCRLHADYFQQGSCECPPGSADGHRRAHCRQPSPHGDRGYYLVETS